MEYTNLGSSGVRVSRIALGTGFRHQLDDAEIIKVVRHALDSGVNFFDCANIYGPGDDRSRMGESEKLLGRALGAMSDEVVITSKVCGDIGTGVNDRGGSRYHILREIERSLGRLGTDHLDLYLMHLPDPETPLEETVSTFDMLVKQGKIRYWGLSNYPAWEACQALSIADSGGWVKPVVMQNPYSLLNRRLEQDFLDFIRRFRLGVMAFSPLAIGLLARDSSDNSRSRDIDLWDDYLEEQFGDVLAAGMQRLRSEVHGIADARHVAPAAVAVSWVLSNDAVTVAIAGPDTPAQLDDYVNAVDLHLETDELNRLTDASRAFVSLI
jgi:aryl-alcohol dehydrogenase-like predicted oxidoreductase